MSFRDEAMGTINNKTRRRLRIVTAALVGAVMTLGGIGCSHPPPQYGFEHALRLPGPRRQVWAVAPVLNLSGERAVDPILQADLVYQELQEVEGLTVIPVNRTAEALAALHWDKVQSVHEAEIVCEMLGCDGLAVATVTAYDPYNPPKLGASLQLFRRAVPQQSPGAAMSVMPSSPPPQGKGATAERSAVAADLNPRRMARQAALPPAANGGAAVPAAATATTMPVEGGDMIQVVGIYDAQNGSVRSAVQRYAQGRNDPVGPYAAKEYFVSMDRYGGFVYHVLIAELLNSPKLWRGTQP